MKFYSLTDHNHKVDFQDALINGLAPDGGLYFPEAIPTFSSEELESLKGNSLNQVAFKVLQKWVQDSIPAEELAVLVDKAQAFPIEIKNVDGYHVLELFHGPTLSFKDVAASYLAQLMQYFLTKSKKHVKLLVATSGDTGGAIAHGFANLENVDVYVLFPKGKVSKLQEAQLTRVAGNVTPIIVDGFFDDCQSIVKQAFVDPDLKALNLTSANSISIGRLLPQIIYYAYTYASLQDSNLEFIVPSGNFGNFTAGLLAWKMGIPISNFIAATNRNDSVLKYYKTGVYDSQDTIQTLSNAMDVGAPSNFQRVLEIFDHDHSAFRKMVKVMKVDDDETIEAIQQVYSEHNYLIDPHTAVAWHCAQKLANKDLTNVIISTASPVKFSGEMKIATHIEVDDSHAMSRLEEFDMKGVEIPNQYKAFRDILLGK